MYACMYRLWEGDEEVEYTCTHNTYTHTTEMTVRGDEVLEKAFSIRKLDLPYVRKLRNNGRE
jgi:hypothetical protein